MAVMVSGKSNTWLSYLGLGNLGRGEETKSQITSSLMSLPEGPGLHRIHEPINAAVDIVFVHGLTGSRKTWYEAQSKTFWPKDLLPKDIPFARIFVWEYDADVFRKWVTDHPSGNDIIAHGSNLCNRLAGHRARTWTQRRPIIFIGHSLGGLIIQKALLHSDESPDELYSDVVDSTAGVVFLGTPHRGSSLANWGGLGADFVHIVKDVNQAIVKLLRPDSRILFQLRDSFIKLVIRRAENRPRALKIKCYFEELGITLIGKIVTEDSAIFEGYPYASIRSNHVEMAKFWQRNGLVDPRYDDVMETISVMIMHALASNFSRREPEPAFAPQTRSLLAESITIPENISTLQTTTARVTDTGSMGRIHELLVAAAGSAGWTNPHAIPTEHFSTAFRALTIPKIPLGRVKNLLRTASFYKITEQSEETPLLETSAPAQPHSKILKLVTQQHKEESLLLRSQSDVQEHESHLLNWLSKINHQEMHNFNICKPYREAGVCISKSPEFQRWRDASRSCLFWLNGAPGTGKSVLSSFVIDALSANANVTVLYFYCRSKQFRNHLSDHVSILRSFLKQLYLRTGSKKIMEEFYQQHKNGTPCDGSENMIILYFELFLKMLSTPQTYIVLDGLDECTEDGIDQLFSAWKHVSQRSPKVLKLFLSSRNTESISSRVNREWSMSQLGSAQFFHTLSVSNSDIEYVINEKFDEVAKEWNQWQSSSGELLTYAKSMLKEQANGSLWRVSSFFQSLRNAAASHIYQETSHEPSKHLPGTLEAAYSHLIASIVSQSPHVASIIEKTFYWLVFGLEPLRARDISAALQLGLNEIDENQLKPLDPAYISQCCKGLVVEDPIDQLRFVHHSASEYLCQRLDSSLAHVYLAKICLAVLTSTSDSTVPANGPAPGASREISGAEGLRAYAQRNHQTHMFKALALDQRIGPYVDPDVLPGVEKLHDTGTVSAVVDFIPGIDRRGFPDA